MQGELELRQNGQRVGTLLRRGEGLHTVFSARLTGGDGLRKICLCGKNGQRMLLGTMLPQGNGVWYLTRRVATGQLNRLGLTEDVYGEVTGDTEPEHQPEPEDGLLREALRGMGKLHWKRTAQGWEIRIPWQVGKPVPLLPIFCFGEPKTNEILYRLDERGYPFAAGAHGTR